MIMLILFIIVPLILSIMLYTLAERKVQGIIQHRIGPNVVGVYGILQPVVDGVKLLIKEILVPQRSIMIIFYLSPIFSFILSVSLWFIFNIVDSSFGLLIILGIGSLEIYGILLGGWSSQNKYTLIGSVRTTSQLISYELILSIIYLLLTFSIGSYRLYYYNINPLNNIIIFLPLYLFMLLVILAETNRTPFDLPESESETVSGFFTEYSSLIFALYFLAEYGNMLFLSYIFSYFFTSTIYLLPLHLFYFIWIRATLPRLRYDHLIKLCWYNLLPILMGFFIFYYSLLLITLI
jgi:NADH-ubiquinone oxidoreductase chain 1